MKCVQPFIILTVGKEQDKLFYYNKYVSEMFYSIKQDVFGEIPNKIIKDNLIRIIPCGSRIIVCHIYPTNFTELHTNRAGQSVIIGFVLNKMDLLINFDKALFSMNLFFDEFRKTSFVSKSTETVPTNFIIKVNKGHYNNYIIKCLMDVEKNMVNVFESKRKVDISNDSLATVYSYIRKRIFYNKKYWILLNSDNKKYYEKELKRLRIISI